MKKYLPTILGVLIIIGGLGSLSKSLPGGLMILIAGLILLPAAKNQLVNRFAVADKLNNKYINYGLVLALVTISAPVIDWSEKNKIIDEFNSNKTSIISEIVSNQDQKKFSQASFIIEKYLKVMPFNDELIGMKSQNEIKKIEDEKLKAAVKLAEKEAAEAKKIAEDAAIKEENRIYEANRYKLPASDGSQPGYMYGLVDTSNGRSEATYSSYGACSKAKFSKPTTNWECFGRPKFTNEK